MAVHADAEPLSSWGSHHGQGQKEVPFQTNKASRTVLLHGNLDIWVRKAENLKTRTGGHYVRVSVSGAAIARTFVIPNRGNPVWMQHFMNVPVAHRAGEVYFHVKNHRVVGSQVIGAVGIPVEKLCSDKKIEGTFPILSDSGKPCQTGAVLSLSIQYTPVEEVNLYHGVGHQGVPGTYFPLRRGGKVTLYQDAHVDHDGFLPDLKLDGGVQYVRWNCWRDIFEAMRQARYFIYIAGWSVNHIVRLIRDGETNSTTDCMLGDLLRTKSQEGVRVLLLVWDDPTSKSILGYKTKGVMKTKAEEIRCFFEKSSLEGLFLLLCARSALKGPSWIKRKEARLIYTHHQKTVIVDADAGDNKRKIVAFVGGLDLCMGRYDTPQHPLFRTLQTVHKDDYHNPTFKKPPVGCPREPWHDLHGRIDGPAAYDILTNFVDRWMSWAPKKNWLNELKHMTSSSTCNMIHVSLNDDALFKIETIPGIIPMTEPCQSRNDPEDWHVQVFRSIDSNSVKGFPKEPKDATKMNLICGKNVLIDMSIHTAYVKAIRAAQKFIYIENQYFLGSSYNWDSHEDLGEGF